jgi:large subunit ribosomal protein L10
MNRADKSTNVNYLTSLFSENSFVVVMNYGPLTFDKIVKFRSELRGVGGTMRFVKNSLAKISSGNVNYDVQNSFVGPTAVVCGDDVVLLSKLVQAFAKSSGCVDIVSGVFKSKVCSKSDIESFANLPTLDGARSQLIALLEAPMSQLCRVLVAPGREIVTVLSKKPE